MVTLNQKRVFEKVREKVVKGGKISVSKEMRGIYADSTAKRPNKLTKSKGWEKLMNKYIPDELLAEKHKELLTVPKIIKTTKRGEYVDSEESLDTNAIKAGLDMGYKLKGKYQAEKVEHSGEIEHELKADEKTKEWIDEFVKYLKLKTK